jgi:hypothetical protein
MFSLNTCLNSNSCLNRNCLNKAAIVSFCTNTKDHADVVQQIEQMAPILTDLIKKWEINPNARPSNKAEKDAVRTLNKMKLLAKDLKGSSGYKQCRRNEIRAMMNVWLLLHCF